MALFRRRRKEHQQPQSARDIADEAVEPFDVRFAAIPSATAAQRRVLAAEAALWQLPEPALDEGEVRWVTGLGVWLPPDHPPHPVRFYLTDRRMMMLLAGRNDIYDPRLPSGHLDYWFDDIAVFDPEFAVPGAPERIRYLVITSESGNPTDGVGSDVEFNLDREGIRFVATATRVLRQHGGLHARLARQESSPQGASDAGQSEPASSIPDRLLGFTRHVPMLDDGRGVTYTITRGSRGRPEFRWSFDDGVPADELMNSILAQEHLASIETELGLPVTFPHATPEGRAAARRKAADHRPTVEALAKAADRGDRLALFQLWGRTGKPVSDPAQLEVGTYYHLGFDLGRYSGCFAGRKWQGTEFEDDEDDNESGTWYEFDVAASTMTAGARLSGDDMHDSAPTDSPAVRVIPATQQEAARMYRERHEAHVAWEARRRSH